MRNFVLASAVIAALALAPALLVRCWEQGQERGPIASSRSEIFRSKH